MHSVNKEKELFCTASMIIEYLKCRADFNFEIDYGLDSAIDMVVTGGILLYLENRIILIHCTFFSKSEQYAFNI